jgi:hypothetical protein
MVKELKLIAKAIVLALWTIANFLVTATLLVIPVLAVMFMVSWLTNSPESILWEWIAGVAMCIFYAIVTVHYTELKDK